jgi:hypothetical protein
MPWLRQLLQQRALVGLIARNLSGYPGSLLRSKRRLIADRSKLEQELDVLGLQFRQFAMRVGEVAAAFQRLASKLVGCARGGSNGSPYTDQSQNNDPCDTDLQGPGVVNNPHCRDYRPGDQQG